MVLNLGKLFALLCLFLVTSGCCFLPADGGLFLSGEAPKGKVCYLTLWDSKGLEEYDKRKVSGSFEATFLVSPCGGDYVIKAMCDEEVTKIYNVSGSDASNIKKPFSLGNIAP